MKHSLYVAYNIRNGFKIVIDDTDNVITCLEGHLGKYHSICNEIAEIRRSVQLLALKCSKIKLSEDMVKKLK